MALPCMLSVQEAFIYVIHVLNVSIHNNGLMMMEMYVCVSVCRVDNERRCNKIGVLCRLFDNVNPDKLDTPTLKAHTP